MNSVTLAHQCPVPPLRVRPGQAWQCGECAAWWLRTSDWPSDQRIRWWTTPILWLRLRRSVPTGQEASE